MPQTRLDIFLLKKYLSNATRTNQKLNFFNNEAYYQFASLVINEKEFYPVGYLPFSTRRFFSNVQ